MLYIVLILVLAALGLVVTALVTADSLWAWLSIGVSVLAGLVLVADWLRRRRRAPVAATEAGETAGDEEETAAGDDEAEQPTAEPTAVLPSSGELDAASDTPAEEETDAADLLVVSGLDIEVLVVDEYPRYHLATCAWLGERDTIPIAVGEARELGFTPCARCEPDATLASQHRSKRKSRADS